MKTSKKGKNLIFQLSAISILLAAIIHYFDTDIAKYVMIAGVAGFAAVVFTSPYPGKSIRGKRLFNIQVVAVLLMVASAYLMFTGVGGWVLSLLIAAMLTLYCSVFIPKEYRKEQENDK